MEKICIIGAGSWGTAQAVLLANNQHQVSLWGRKEDGVELIPHHHENRQYLPGVLIPEQVRATSDLAEAMEGAQWVIMAVPTQSYREVLAKVHNYLNNETKIVNTAKGLEMNTGLRMSEITAELLGERFMERFAVLSGPSHAEEVARAIPTAVTAASVCPETAYAVQDLYMSSSIRVYSNNDVAGVELGGAIKNIIALSTGIAFGLGYGDNTMAALMTRALTEMVRMGVAMGGDPYTFSGLSGIGDLVVTCGSRHSRNRQAGELIGKGWSLEDTLGRIGMVVEGVYSCRIVHKIAMEKGIDMPITRGCYQILYENRDPREVVLYLMQRQKKQETEEFVRP